MDESAYQGDLADIVRAGGGAISFMTGSNSGEASLARDWRFASGPTNYVAGMEEAVDDFGDPFSDMQDPLLYELGVSSSDLFGSANNCTDTIKVSVDDRVGSSGSGTVFCQSAVDEETQLKRPSNLFSKMFQISPNTSKLPVSPMPCDSPIVGTSPRLHKPPAGAATDRMMGMGSEACLGESSTAGTVQIPSPRHTSLKRRKCQAKKVVCIPAPAPVNSRSSGEVVPSDLWAWRKYGQKPIKGSPYPRGYYRCSSSKGCPARKQVERSRTDSNMLVITYTSEHNHPWPTQRNALAGSARSQPPKTTNAASKNISPDLGAPKTTSLDAEEQLKDSNVSSTDHNVSSSIITTENSSTDPSMKEEMEDMDKKMEMDGSEFRPTLPDSNQQSHHHHQEDFFADLGEIDANPLNLLFTHGFTVDEERENSSKALDPFSLFDWIGNNNNNSPSFGDTKRGIL